MADTSELPSGTVTFLLTDIEGSTVAWERDPTGMAAAVARHYDLLDAVVAAHNGRRPVEQGEGDSVVAAFVRATDAVAAAVDAQDVLGDLGLRARIAIHTGEAELRDPARAALARVGLADRGDVLVSNLSHGEHRQLEIAMALATSPRMLLLDEPMAGMGPDESARMVKTLRELKRELTILLIEHDMEAVFALADQITVLVYGRIIASGSPEAIRANAEVRQAYLGEQEQAHA